MRRICFRLALFLAVSVAAPGVGGAAEAVSPDSPFPHPARPVAGVVSPIWHSEAERDAAGEVPQVVRWLGIEAGMTVADIGAGSGYYTVRLSPIVGPSGLVIAEDVTPDYVRTLEGKVASLHLANVAVTLGEPTSPRLLPRSVDRALLIHMYHEVAEPFALLYNLGLALKPGGSVGIVDADRPILEHGTPPALLFCELEAMGYAETAFHPLAGSDAYLAVFELPPGKGPAHPPIVSCGSP